MARMTARAPQRSHRSAGETGAAVKLVVVIALYQTPD